VKGKGEEGWGSGKDGGGQGAEGSRERAVRGGCGEVMGRVRALLKVQGT